MQLGTNNAMASKSIIWLASYPKSGNTWTRAFLANYILAKDEPVPINEMRRFTFGDSMIGVYEKVHGGSIAGLSDEQILHVRARMFTGLSANGADMNFVKSHNINGVVHGCGLIPPHLTRLAIYILRNPLGVIPSYSRHFGMDVDQTIHAISHSLNSSKGNDNNVREYMGSWSEHVGSWAKTKKFPVHVMRYEDMLKDPQKTFGKLVRKVGLPFDKDQLDKAIEFSSFKELKRQEKTYGFIEQSDNSESFFHSGASDAWKDELTEKQISKVRELHGKTMQRFGYF